MKLLYLPRTVEEVQLNSDLSNIDPNYETASPSIPACFFHADYAKIGVALKNKNDYSFQATLLH